MKSRVWTFWPCGCAMFPTNYWIMCDGCLRPTMDSGFSLIPGLFCDL